MNRVQVQLGGHEQVAIPVVFDSLRRENVKEKICELLHMEPRLSGKVFINFLYEKIRDTRPFV